MSQRRYGQAPFPDDTDTGRPSDTTAPDDGRGAAPGSRWSSPSRRRRRDHLQPTASHGLEGQDADRYPPGVDDSLLAPWPSEPAFVEPRANDRGAGSDDSGGYDEVDLDYPVPTASYRSRRTARPRPTVVMPRVQVPASIAGADIVRDPLALALLGAGVILTLVSALVTFSRVRRLPDVIELLYDAYGVPIRWGPPESLWQLPLLAAMVIIISLVLAVAVSRHDRFASQFLLAAALVVGLLSWVPLARFLW